MIRQFRRMSCNCDIGNKSFRAEFRADEFKNVRLVNRVLKNLISMLYLCTFVICCFKRDLIDILCGHVL